jgi:dTDP-4-dehydrorhamnose 3,5-epimerase
MIVLDTPIAGLHLVRTETRHDQRGAFTRLFCEQELAPLLGERRIVQINHSRTTRCGAVRGLHFQRAPWAEMKFVRCLAGRVWDVAVDLRENSPTFLRWHAQELSSETGLTMAIPEGFAHGFQALTADSELLYLHTAPYRPDFEGGLRHDDPRLAISWPEIPTDVSDRDRSHPLIGDDARSPRLSS